jgi:hypothetical protein
LVNPAFTGGITVRFPFSREGKSNRNEELPPRESENDWMKRGPEFPAAHPVFSSLSRGLFFDIKAPMTDIRLTKKVFLHSKSSFLSDIVVSIILSHYPVPGSVVFMDIFTGATVPLRRRWLSPRI